MGTTTQETTGTTRKSGKGANHGLVSEVSAFFHIKPGHVDELRTACQRFGNKIKNAPPQMIHRFGLRDMRHVIFDNDTRLCWMTAFETDWDPYIDDSVNMLGLPTWIDWFQHCEEYPDDFAGYSNAQVKAFIQSAQATATAFVRSIPDLTMVEIRKGQRVRSALDRVLDSPNAATLLQNPALKPLLDEAADN
jgi:hypothetical protein